MHLDFLRLVGGWICPSCPSRYFTKSRGKALSTCWFGLSTAEFVLPVLIVYLLTLTTWQNAQNIRTRSQSAGNNGTIFVISQETKKEYDPSEDLPPTYSEVTTNPSKYKEIAWDNV